MPTKALQAKRGGTREEHLRFMLVEVLEYVPLEGVEAAALALLPYLGTVKCPILDNDCGWGACGCDGSRDALQHALRPAAPLEGSQPTEEDK